MRFSVIISLFLLCSFVQVQGACDPPEDYVLSGGIEELSKQAAVVVYGRIESIGQFNCSSGELEPMEQPLFQGDMFDAIVQLKCIYSDNQAYIKGSERIVVTGFGSEFDCLSSVVEDEEYIIMLQPSTNYSICSEEDDFPLEVYLARYDYASSAVAPATVENLELIEATKTAKACAEVTVSETGTSVSSASSAVSSQGSPASSKGAVAESIGTSSVAVSLANITAASNPNTTNVAAASSVEGSSATSTLSDTVSVVKESELPTSTSTSSSGASSTVSVSSSSSTDKLSETISVVNASFPSTSSKTATSSSNGDSVVESSSSVVTSVNMLPGTLTTVDVLPSSTSTLNQSVSSVSVAGSDSVSQSSSSASSTAPSVETVSKSTAIVGKDAELTQVESCEALEGLCVPICGDTYFEASCDMDAGINAELNCTCIDEPPKCASARAMCETQCLNQGFADFKCEKQNGAFSASCACAATQTKQEEGNMQPETQAEEYCEKVCGQTKADHDFALELLSKEPLSYGFYCACAGLKESVNNVASLDELNNQNFDIMNCFLPAQTGACKANLSAYYFDITLNACQEFTYGGCDGNANNFETLEDCEELCGSALNSTLGEEILSDFEVNLVEAAIPVCERPKQEENIKAFIPRFYYNPLTETCQKFIYGGGASNGNNFFTEQECLAACFVLDK